MPKYGRIPHTAAARLGAEANRIAKQGGGPYKPNNLAGYGGMNLLPQQKKQIRAGKLGRAIKKTFGK